jgi:hypothetical protein
VNDVAASATPIGEPTAMRPTTPDFCGAMALDLRTMLSYAAKRRRSTTVSLVRALKLVLLRVHELGELLNLGKRLLGDGDRLERHGGGSRRRAVGECRLLLCGSLLCGSVVEKVQHAGERSVELLDNGIGQLLHEALERRCLNSRLIIGGDNSIVVVVVVAVIGFVFRRHLRHHRRRRRE